jgi:predicted secreted protein
MFPRRPLKKVILRFVCKVIIPQPKNDAKIIFVSGKANPRQNFFKNRAGDEPHPLRQKSFGSALKKRRTKAPNALGGDKRRPQNRSRKTGKYDCGANLQ